jgi:hypothetical protein
MQIPMSEVYLGSTENGILMQKYQLVRKLQETLSKLNDGKGRDSRKLTDLTQMQPHKVYYVQDYKNKKFYYEVSEATLRAIKASADIEISSLIGRVAGMVDFIKGFSKPLTSEDITGDRFERFKTQKVEITEI